MERLTKDELKVILDQLNVKYPTLPEPSQEDLLKAIKKHIHVNI